MPFYWVKATWEKGWKRSYASSQQPAIGADQCVFPAYILANNNVWLQTTDNGGKKNNTNQLEFRITRSHTMPNRILACWLCQGGNKRERIFQLRIIFAFSESSHTLVLPFRLPVFGVCTPIYLYLYWMERASSRWWKEAKWCGLARHALQSFVHWGGRNSDIRVGTGKCRTVERHKANRFVVRYLATTFLRL